MALLQYKTNTSTNGNPCAMALDNPTQAGSTLFVVVQDYYSTSVFGFTHSVADDQGNSYTKNFDNSAWANLSSSEVWSAPVTSPGTTTVTISMTGGGYVIGFALEYPSVSAAPFDTSSANDPNSTTYTSNATATTAQAAELLLGTNHSQTSGMTLTPDGSWTAVATAGDGFHTANVQQQTVAATGTYAETGTASAAVRASVIVTYKLSGGGPAFVAKPPLTVNQAVNRASTF